MKKLSVLSICFLLSISFIYADDLSQYFAGGTGTSEDPYQISTVQQLQNINLGLAAYYELINDIDASATQNWNDGKGFDPIGDMDIPFVGSFDGKGYTISNLYINRPDEDYVGLFGYGDVKANVSAISLSNTFIQGNDYVGGLMGYNDDQDYGDKTYLRGSVIKSEILGNNYVGGILGKGRFLSNSFCEDVSVVGNDYVGGITGSIVGYDDISGLYFNGNVSGHNYVGGLIGWFHTHLLLSNSYSIGNIKAYRYAGGLTGSLTRVIYITNSYSTMNLEGDAYIGTLAGESWGGGVNNSFSIGSSNFTGFFTYYPSIIGGNTGSYSNLYFYNGSENSPVSCLLYGSTDENCVAIPNISYFYNSSNAPMSSWDFENVWTEVEGGFPILRSLVDHYELFNNTQTNQGGFANNIALSEDNIVFLANNDDGLRAYRCEDTSLTPIAHINETEEVNDVAVGVDNIVFACNRSEGLRAYDFTDSSFTRKAHIDNGGIAEAIILDTNGTVFLANNSDGLRAYTFNGSSFINIAHIYEDGTALGLALGADSTVFVANGSDGLRAYYYDVSSFTPTAYINEGGYASNVAVSDDGTVFLANGYGGLRAYAYDGSSFIPITNIHVGGFASDVALGSDNMVYLANGEDGLRVYSYDGTSFIEEDHINNDGNARGIAINPEGKIFLANGNMGLSVFNLSAHPIPQADIFLSTPYIESAGSSLSIPIIVEQGQSTIASMNFNIIFESDYLTYQSSNSKYLSSDNISVSANVVSVLKANDGTIFDIKDGDTLLTLVFNADENVQEGSVSFINFGDSSYVSDSLGAELNVSSRRGYIKFTNITRIATIPNEFKLNQNYPNPFNPITTISYDLPQASDVKLKVYDITGQLVQTLVDKKQSTGQYRIRWNASQYSSGLYFYRFQTDDFVQTKKMILIK